MICCLLALLAAFPGVALIRRMPASCVQPVHGASLCVHGMRRDVVIAVTAAGAIVAVMATALAIHRLNHETSWRGFGPICSVLDPASPIQARASRVVASK